ncbi:family 2 encapsulin nanocompartment cargo protein terpene cyclase [Streptomyces sp. NBC_01808]|uniref:family 2 encapsulin nanocompartment cargo protein terpene cyclase n=1 Tax=Streptomyces sp. NBC_01808 TaxID=2975947 RepID=UPI002DDA7744|nr:family 2 encapsulin nanocompartment cargo protein terpene cyclase [Streptomyces sp. NBC_01808]WSA38745.1 family 2 encapsulin nanocompartment cargo protein terpene cyclase [Streptomyces sp. NBC_01808]
MTGAPAEALRALLPLGPTGLGTAAAHPLAGYVPEAVPPPEAEPPARTKPGPEPASGAGPDTDSDSGSTAGPEAGTAPPPDGGAERGGLRIPPLYCPDALRNDPALGDEVNERLVAWAEEIGIFTGRIERLRSHQFGRLFMLAHPDCDDPDRLLAAAKCGLSEWSVDDHWVDEGEDPDPALLGERMALAHAVIDPVRLPARYMPQFEETVQREPVLRAFRSALAHLSRYASPTQVARLRHELAVMFVGYGQEAEWRSSARTPAVWEYLLHRYENAFFPCMVLVDPVSGYELPPDEFADARVRRTYLYAGTASVLLNDLYSMGKEDPTDTNLPNLIAAEEGCTLQEAVDRTALIHDELMHTYEMEAAALTAAGSPQLGRFLAGVWAWMGGCKEWHATSARYQTA